MIDKPGKVGERRVDESIIRMTFARAPFSAARWRPQLDKLKPFNPHASLAVRKIPTNDRGALQFVHRTFPPARKVVRRSPPGWRNWR